MLSGDNGILQKATTAKENTTNSQITERIQLAYHAALTGGQGSYTKDTLMAELKKEFETDYDVDDSDNKNWKMKAHGQEVTIPAGKPNVYKIYSLGQEVTIGGEQFFVIEENDTEVNESITVISKYNLNTSENAQQNEPSETTSMAFCTQSYWSNDSTNLNGIESENALAYNKAVAYAEAKGGTGRLLTKAEAEKFTSKVDESYTNETMAKIIFGQDYSRNPVKTDNFLKFWLDSVNYGAPPRSCLVS